MIEFTIGELLDGFELGIEGIGHNVYVVRDGDVVFYVGRSDDPLDRLMTHMGKGLWSWCTPKSRLGYLIEANLPESRDWQVELLTVNDCAPQIKALCPYFALNRCGSHTAEQAMIRALHPCLNVIHNTKRMSLPDDIKDPLMEGRTTNPAEDLIDYG